MEKFLMEKGYGIIPKLVMVDKNIGGTAKLIYAYFCSYCGNNNMCFPSQYKICSDLGISKETCRKYIKQLVNCQYIKVKQRKNKRFGHNTYILLSKRFEEKEVKEKNANFNLSKQTLKKVDDRNISYIKPVCEKTVHEKTVHEETVHEEMGINNNITNNNILNNNIINKSVKNKKNNHSHTNIITKKDKFYNKKQKYGEYGWIKLNDKEYNELLNLMGKEELKRCIDYIDSSAESTKNKNHWKGWKAVLEKCYKYKWGTNWQEKNNKFIKKFNICDFKNNSFSVNDLIKAANEKIDYQ